MNINDFKFYRKNNRYYFESHTLEGSICKENKMIYALAIDNGEIGREDELELLRLFNENFDVIMGAEAL